MSGKTIRLVDQQWQGGMNEDYSFGSRLLSHIVPPSYSKNTETIFTPISSRAVAEGSIAGGKSVLEQMQATFDILTAKAPARVVTIGGDCDVSEAPFDYLHGKYPDNLGIIWLDAHPDVSDQSNSEHVHEMVLANLLQQGAKAFNDAPKNPFKPENVLLAGLQYKQLRPMDEKVDQLGLKYVIPDQLLHDSLAITSWVREHNYSHLAVHLDLDVLTPNDFHSILPAEPGLDLANFDAAVGTLKLSQVLRTLRDISATADVVGLTLAEHMPWDALRLRKGLSDLRIFE